MSRLDRAKARAYLISQFGLPDLPDEIGEAELDALEACVVPAPQPTIDRDALRDELRAARARRDWELEAAVDHVLALVRPVEQQTIDREQLVAELRGSLEEDYEDFMSADEITALAEYQAGRILALVRPVEGVVLTSEEVAILRTWAPPTDGWLPEDRALAARLEASS
jgi:hypothetical protein